MSAFELEAQPLRYSEDVEEEIRRDLLGDRLSGASTSPYEQAIAAISPPPPIPPRRPRPPRHGHAPSSSLGTEGSRCSQRPEYDPFFTFPPFPVEEENNQSRLQETSDSDGRKQLRETLEMKVRLFQSTNDVGQFLVSNYRGRDSVLNGMVTRMAAERESNVVIATTVLKELGLRPEEPERPQLVMRYRTPQNARRYPQEDETTDIACPSSVPGPTTRAAKRQDREVSPTTMWTSRPPVSNQKSVPYRLQTSAAAGPSSTSDFTGPSVFRVREATLLTPRPNRSVRILPQWTNGVIGRIKSDLDMHEANLLRGEIGSICQVADDDIPILRPATMQRVRRGYYDEALDGVRLKAQKAIGIQGGTKDGVGPMAM